jgi:cardiolipin synthase
LFVSDLTPTHETASASVPSDPGREHGIGRAAIETALERATGGVLSRGNQVRLQFDGPYTFDTWIEAIRGARRFVHFENYILRNDRTGHRFRDALIAKAREGIEVRVLYDWMGCWATPRRFWKPFREAGVEVRAYNPPSVTDPFGLLQRDHRKLVCVDGEVAFAGGFCVGNEWAGTETEPPWRDTGVEIRGPAAVVATHAFEKIWALMGAPVEPSLRLDPADAPAAGDTAVWLIEGEPGRARVYRAIQLIAATARERMWITDPYFVTPKPVLEALIAAARDGVDVRVLVPARNNWPWVGSLVRGGYRTLLEAGVRVFEWQGPMIHAKTSVTDGLWCRVGSTNLNRANLLGNWEIDVGIVDRSLGTALEGLFLADLMSSVEIVLPGALSDRPQFVEPEADPEGPEGPPRESLEPTGLMDRLDRVKRPTSQGGSSGWRMASVLRASSTLGEAIAGRRTMGRESRTALSTAAVGVLIIATLAAFFPVVFGWAMAAVLGWLGIVLGVRALAQARRARTETTAERLPTGNRSEEE